jgi:succinate dehydrogenase / fumarate reductase, cytochrome b subunit
MASFRITSSLGKKFLMAISGAALFGFVIGHLAGNLQIFLGQDAINAYAVFLKGLGGGLWLARIGLLVMVGIHIATSISLTKDNVAARPVAYVGPSLMSRRIT